ncbi:MAG: amidase [Geminicoccaceae bacterium]
MTDDTLAQQSAADLAQLYRTRQASPVQATQAALARIERWNEATGAFCQVYPDSALAAAVGSEERWRTGDELGPLDGVPATIKDIIHVQGWPTRRGSRTLADAGPESADAPITARLREAGAVLLGKTTTPEFGWKAVTDNPFGEVARNPFDLRLTAGGSSGGAAIAAALGMGVLHVGTDGGGSIRIPSAFCGIVGLKPTFGRVPAWPLSPFGTVAHLGPMTRTVADAAAMMNAVSRPDLRDWHGLPYDDRDYTADLDAGIAGLRIAASVDLGHLEVDPEIRSGFVSLLKTVGDLGAVVVEEDPGFANSRDLFAATWFPAAARVVDTLDPAKRQLVDPGLLEAAAEGRDVDAARLLTAQAERGAMGVAMQLFFGRYDLLLTPAVAVKPLPAGAETVRGSGQRRWIDWAGFSFPFNLTQQPAAVVPFGRTKDGLPLSCQVVGPKYADALVLRACRAIERALPQPQLTAPVAKPLPQV